MLNEFKKFILKGNVVDLSTGVIIGAAFGNVVTAFTKGIIEPILGMFGGGPNPDLKISFGEKIIKVTEKVADKGPDGVEKMVDKLVEKTVPFLQFDIGMIVGAILGFLITAALIFFFIVKPANKLMAMMKKEEAAAPAPAPAADIVLLTEIRDLLKK